MKTILGWVELYGRINLFVQAKFSSTYSLVLYENCVRFKNIKQTSRFSVNLFRALMGIPEWKYVSFKELKRNVINVALKEINQKADIYIEPQFTRVRRNIIAIQFTIKENENYQPSFKKLIRPNINLTKLEHQTTFIDVLTSQFSFTPKQAREIIEKYGPVYLLEKINLIKSKKRVEHPGAYLIAALHKDYKPNRSQPSELPSKSPYTYQREAKNANEIASLRNKYMAYKFKSYRKYVEQQNDETQRNIQALFECHLKQNKEVFRFYKKSKFTSPFVMGDFMSFIDKNFPNIIRDYLNFEDFITEEEP